jgi:peptidoglycan/LPS O-acetylase OafA/YrhL
VPFESTTKRKGLRLKELDSLRGIAALAVSFFHMQLAVGAVGIGLTLLSFTPLHGLLDGYRAVLFFFVLSGFVLAIPFTRGPISPTAFLVKRVVRIYPAYWICLAVSIGAFSIFENPHLGFNALANYIGLVGGVTQNYDTVTWSLVQEMRLSILFPLIMLPVLRFRSRWVLIGSLSLIVVPYALPLLGRDGPVLILGSFVETAYYAWFFVIGAVAAKHIERMVAYVRAMNTRRAALWLAVAIVIYGMLPAAGFAARLEEGVVSIAIIGLMVFGLARPGLSRLLLSPILQFVGRISYSYYLLHAVVIKFLVHLLFPVVPGLAIAVAAIGGTLLVAWIVYRWIEVPSIKLGQALYVRITARIQGPRPVFAPAPGPKAPALRVIGVMA